MDEISTAQFCCKPSKSHHKGNKIKWYLYLRRKFFGLFFSLSLRSSCMLKPKNTILTTYGECRSQKVCMSTWASFEVVINIQRNKVFHGFILCSIAAPKRRDCVRSNLGIMMPPCTLCFYLVSCAFNGRGESQRFCAIIDVVRLIVSSVEQTTRSVL